MKFPADPLLPTSRHQSMKLLLYPREPLDGGVRAWWRHARHYISEYLTGKRRRRERFFRRMEG